MKTLEQANAEAMRNQNIWSHLSLPTYNGIECPKCGGELMDTHPDQILTSNPAQKEIHCPKCGYKGFRIA